MLGSNCNHCCHFKNNKCLANQFYISSPKCSFAPGFCRMYRSEKWAENKNTDNESLVQLSRKESELNYDLIVIHNNDDHLKVLESNLLYNYCPVLSSANKFNNPLKQIIIADTTNKKDRSQIIDLFKIYKGPKKLDILVKEEEEKPANTIKRISRLIKEKYFVVIPSSTILSGRDNEIMINEINKDTRLIFWPFTNRLAQTIVLTLHPIYGLYIKNSYDKLTQLEEIPRTFYERLKEEEISTGISLSCCLDIVV